MREDWDLAISGEILDVRDGTHDTPKYVDEQVHPLVTSKNLKNGLIDLSNVKYISNNDFQEINKRSKVDIGDVLFAMIGTIGNPVVITQEPHYSIKNIGLFKNKHKAIESKLLGYYLDSLNFYSQLEKRQFLKGTTQKFIPLGYLRNLEIPIAPIPEQRVIVAKIEELFSDLDKGISDLKKAQDQLVIYRQAVLKKAFEGEYSLMKVGDLFDFLGGGTPSKVEKEYWNGDIPWASVKDIKGDFLTQTQDYITEKGFKNSSANLALKGSVILITRISPGKALITNIDTAINQDLKIVKPKRELNSRFIYFLFRSIERDCVRLSSGTTVLGINLQNLKSIEIPDIGIQKQDQIVKEIEFRLSVCDKVEQSITESLEKAKALRQSILKKAFEGKLLSAAEIERCKQEQDYEPAAVLLEKIKVEKKKKK